MLAWVLEALVRPGSLPILKAACDEAAREVYDKAMAFHAENPSTRGNLTYAVGGYGVRLRNAGAEPYMMACAVVALPGYMLNHNVLYGGDARVMHDVWKIITQKGLAKHVGTLRNWVGYCEQLGTAVKLPEPAEPEPFDELLEMGDARPTDGREVNLYCHHGYPLTVLGATIAPMCGVRRAYAGYQTSLGRLATKYVEFTRKLHSRHATTMANFRKAREICAGGGGEYEEALNRQTLNLRQVTGALARTEKVVQSSTQRVAALVAAQARGNSVAIQYLELLTQKTGVGGQEAEEAISCAVDTMEAMRKNTEKNTAALDEALGSFKDAVNAASAVCHAQVAAISTGPGRVS